MDAQAVTQGVYQFREYPGRRQISDDGGQPMDMPGYDDGRPEQPVGVGVRRDGATVRVMGEDLPLTLGVERAARLLGVGRSSMYAAVKRGDIDTMRLNGRTVVLTVPLLQRMGLNVQ